MDMFAPPMMPYYSSKPVELAFYPAFSDASLRRSASKSSQDPFLCGMSVRQECADGPMASRGAPVECPGAS